jgi:hypothetical protein
LARFTQVPELPLGVGERQRVSGGFEKEAVTGPGCTGFGTFATTPIEHGNVKVH